MKNISKLILNTLLLFMLSGVEASAQNPKTDSLLTLLKTAKQDTSHVNTLNAITREYINTGDYELAISYAEKAETLAKTLGFKKGLAQALNNHGVIYIDQGNNPKAHDYYLRSLKIREEIGDKKGIATSLNNIGNIYILQGDYPKAFDYNLRSLKIREEIGIHILTNFVGGFLGSLGSDLYEGYSKIDKLKGAQYFMGKLIPSYTIDILSNGVDGGLNNILHTNPYSAKIFGTNSSYYNSDFDFTPFPNEFRDNTPDITDVFILSIIVVRQI